eukprot:430114_1
MSVQTQQRLQNQVNRITQCISLTMSFEDEDGEADVTQMQPEVVDAAREYYLNVITSQIPFSTQKEQIHQDLVIGTKDKLLQIHSIDTKPQRKLSLKYCIGLDNDEIQTINSEIICVGRNPQNDILSNCNTVSRIHCFIFSINDKLIVFDGWSKGGTKTIDIVSNNNAKQNIKLINSNKKQRNILQYNINDTIHLQLGRDCHIIINPKECLICMDNRRIKKTECGHTVCCNKCFKELKNCPICRKAINHQNDGNKQNSFGMHTFSPPPTDKTNKLKRKLDLIEVDKHAPDLKRQKLNK